MGFVASIEQRIYCCLVGAACMSSLSIAGTNIFLALGAIGFLHRAWRKHDDLPGRLSGISRFLWAPYLLLALAALLSIAGAPHPLADLLDFGNSYLLRPLPFLLVVLFVREGKKARGLALAMAVSVGLNALLAIGQWLMHDMAYGARWSGGIFYMAQGTILAAALPIALLLAMREKKYRACCTLLFLLLAAAFLLNGTRGAWVASLAVMSVIAFVGLKWKSFLAGTVAMVLLVGAGFTLIPPIHDRMETILHYQKEHSYSERALLWKSSAAMLMDHPLTGVGQGEFREAYQTKYICPEAKEPWLGHAHDNVVHAFAETGILGGMAFLAFWVSTVYCAIRSWHRHHDTASLAMAALIMAFMLHGLTEYTWGGATQSKFLFLALGICVAFQNIRSASGSDFHS